MARIVERVEKVASRYADSRRKCIICRVPATHYIRGYKNSIYCRKCAKDHFGFLHYLDKI